MMEISKMLSKHLFIEFFNFSFYCSNKLPGRCTTLLGFRGVFCAGVLFDTPALLEYSQIVQSYKYFPRLPKNHYRLARAENLNRMTE